MERLTFDGDFCDIALCSEPRGGSFCEDGSCSQRKVWERLKEYEDTGLTPEVCANYKAFEDEAISKGVTFARIVELMEADQDGRVFVAPCKAGDTVYELRDSRHAKGPGITPRIVARVLVSFGGGYVVYHSGPLGLWSVELGYTWFLTREEAEKALEDRKK